MLRKLTPSRWKHNFACYYHNFVLYSTLLLFYGTYVGMGKDASPDFMKTSFKLLFSSLSCICPFELAELGELAKSGTKFVLTPV
jgi:hypothetical protein